MLVTVEAFMDLVKENLSKEEIIKAIAAAGIVGMGGATFPTQVKLTPPPGNKAEYLIINGVECEPYLTADHRVMLEKGKEILTGVQLLMKAIEVNKDKGAVARKACKAACIGCGKCAKECQFGAITVENNLAYIDFTKCRLCRKCVSACPTGAIHEVNFPPRKTETGTAQTASVEGEKNNEKI